MGQRAMPALASSREKSGRRVTRFIKPQEVRT
jgi:hypothetical protein